MTLTCIQKSPNDDEKPTLLFHPESISVIGAFAKPESLGYKVMKNLMSSGFAGPQSSLLG